MIDQIRAALAAHRFSFSTEDELQRGIAQALDSVGIAYRREVVLTRNDRIDFLLGKLGIEVKIDGSISALTRQVHRYAHLEAIDELVVVVGRIRLTQLPKTINGKTIHTVSIVRAF